MIDDGPNREISPATGDCLLIVDLQNDFLPGGALPAPEGQRVIAPLNEYIACFREAALPIVATRDWHPANHCSFQPFGGPWPPHAVAGTWGARFAPPLKLPDDVLVVSKATSPDVECYSDFQGTGLANQLRRSGVGRIFVGGLATDYCVLASVEDALAERFQVVLLLDAIQAIDVQPGDGQRAVERMIRGGAVAALWKTRPDGTRHITSAD
jgi:nicotinamidase/pyrazinamidase